MEIKVMIYEDNDHLRNSMLSLFEWNADHKVILAKSNPASILSDVQQNLPDIILMDIDMPEMDGITALKILRVHYPELPVIMLTIFDDQENIYQAICAGASGYLLKHDFENIISSIQDVLKGGAPMTGAVAKKVLASLSGIKPKSSIPTNILTPREMEILNGLVKGLSYKMIADQCSLSLDTIRTHIKKIYKKLQVNSATEAIYKINQSQ